MKTTVAVFTWQEVDAIDPEDGTVRRCYAMVPLQRFDNLCKRQYNDGCEYPLLPVEVRSRASHAHFFAAINEGFDNLPEKFCTDHRWTCADDMRKDLLIEAGFGEEKKFECVSADHAIKLATFIRDETGFSKITFLRDERGRPTIVRVRRAKSQDLASMDRATFEDSKKKVLMLLEGIIGLARGDLMRHAARSA